MRRARIPFWDNSQLPRFRVTWNTYAAAEWLRRQGFALDQPLTWVQFDKGESDVLFQAHHACALPPGRWNVDHRCVRPEAR